jgi:hypothetical protein
MIAKCLGHSSSLAASASSKMTAILNQLSCSKTFAYAEQTGYAEYADYAEYAEYAEGVPNELCKDLKKKQVHQMEMIVRHLWSIVVCLNSVDF